MPRPFGCFWPSHVGPRSRKRRTLLLGPGAWDRRDRGGGGPRQFVSWTNGSLGGERGLA